MPPAAPAVWVYPPTCRDLAEMGERSGVSWSGSRWQHCHVQFIGNADHGTAEGHTTARARWRKDATAALGTE